MTICVPQRPFVILGEGLIYSALFSWVITLPLAVLNLVFNYKVGDPELEIVFGSISFILSMALMSSLNQEHHWIEWCRTKEKEGLPK